MSAKSYGKVSPFSCKNCLVLYRHVSFLNVLLAFSVGCGVVFFIGGLHALSCVLQPDVEPLFVFLCFFMSLIIAELSCVYQIMSIFVAEEVCNH